jgi:hypothetical protein
VNASRRVVRLRMRAGSRAAVAAAGLALALAGCTVTNPQETVTPFDAGDGRSGQIGGTDANSGILLRNFLVVSNAKGAPGRVIGAISNKTGDAAKVQLAVVSTGSDGQPQSLGQTVVDVGAGQFVQIGSPPASATSGSATSSIGSEPAAGEGAELVVPQVPVAPGSVLQLVAGTAASGNTSIDMPVLPAVGEYQALAPSASPSAQPSTVTPTGSASPSANPSGAASQPPGSTPGQEPTASAS